MPICLKNVGEGRMEKKSLSLFLLWVLLLAGYVPIASTHNEPFPGGYDPTHMVIDSIREPETVDPAWCYDTASAGLIFNVYETVILFDAVYTDGPYEAGKTDVFNPQLATDVSITSGPSPYVKTFYFKIRGTGPVETFIASASDVPLFKDGQIRAGSLHVRDPDYGMVGMDVGPITSPTATPSADGFVDKVNVTGNAYIGGLDLVGTTWHTPSFDYLITSYIDTGLDGLGFSDIIDAVRVCSNGVIYWNVRVWFHVLSVDSTDPYTITVEPVPVYFHDGVSTLTPADVEYSWERWLVQDRSSGPAWMLYHPLLETYGAMDPGTDPNFGDKINHAIGSNATHTWISLTTDFPETRFLQIISQSWASIVNKDWCIAHGDFDGDWAVGWEYIYDTWHDPSVSFIEDDMMGTGPYMFDYWVHATAWSIVKYDDYWDGWSAYNSPTGTERLPGYLSRVTLNLMVSWTTRRARFLAGDADYTYVSRQFRDQVLGQVVGGEKIRCFYPVEPQLMVDVICFNFNVSLDSPLLGGPAFDPTQPYKIAEDRIPINLFSDIHMRRGFADAFDFSSFLSTAYLDEAEQPSDPTVVGLSYDNPMQAKPTFDLAKAAEELKAAWIGHPDDDPATPEGAIWDRGMTFTLNPYGAPSLSSWPTDDLSIKIALVMLKNSISSLNSKFHLNIPAKEVWPLPLDMQPIFSFRLLADYPDADNFAYTFMHHHGKSANFQSYSNPRVDQLIEAGALMPDDTTPYNGELDYPDPRPYFNNPSGIPPDTRWPRRSIYYELQAIYVQDVLGFGLVQAKGRVWQQAWMRGWYYNPVYRGNYFYHLWKAQTHFGDVNNDGIVDLLDAATISAHWYPGPPRGPLGYNPNADINGGTGGTTGSNNGTVEGIPDGKVNILDSALVSAYWDGPPQGPAHP